MSDREKLIGLLIEADKAALAMVENGEVYCVNEVMMRIADHLLANGVTVQRWIPVTERLPNRSDADKDGRIIAICKYTGQVGVWDFGSVKQKYVTHWMPLPEPPKESAE